MLCCYTNSTTQIQIAKITGNDRFEKVVFPFEKILFEAPLDGELKIFTQNRDRTTALVDAIPCQRLQSYAVTESAR